MLWRMEVGLWEWDGSHDGIHHLGSGAIGHLQDDAGLGAGCACYAVCGRFRAGVFMSDWIWLLATCLAGKSPWPVIYAMREKRRQLILPGNEPPGRAGKG